MDEKYLECSHRRVEKHRRDRINQCLVDLSRSVLVEFSRKAPGKLEKAEILETTVLYLRALEAKRAESQTVNRDFANAFYDGYTECMEVVQQFLDAYFGPCKHERCSGLVDYLNSRYSEKCLQSSCQYFTGETGTLQRFDRPQTDSARLMPGVMGSQQSQTPTSRSHKLSRRSWEEEFFALKQTLKRKLSY
ncbi:transcription factor cwo-like [Physella acuta]|uniref:transcription factor cwo-like n=1 Tax=Physella acuta TaxID=109671 RepID=UPI0027DC8EB5|nr:transcription factor cwo-like [Physella acuta]